MDGLLTAVFDAFSLKEQPEQLLAEGDALPLFCNHTYQVNTNEGKARRVWTGLEKHLSQEAMKLISVSWLSEQRELNNPLFQYVYKVFKQGDISKNFADPDVLAVTNIARRVLHEQLRMNSLSAFRKRRMALTSQLLHLITTCYPSLSNISKTDSMISPGSSMTPNGTTDTTTMAKLMPSTSPLKTKLLCPST